MLITLDKTIETLHSIFEPYFSVQYLDSSDISKKSLKDSVALIVRSTRKYGSDVLLGTGVKFIGTVTSGYEHIDTEFCEKNGIFLATAHGSNAQSVAEYVSAALTEISKKIDKPLKELSLGIVGVGAVGSCVKRNAEDFGMKLFLCDPPKNLNDNIFDADIITLHTPLEKDGEYPTYHLADKDFFSKMKKGAWLINAARGAVCDSEALRRALKSKRLGGAVADVWENEPNIDATLLPLIEIATPHIAGHNAEAKINAANMMINSISEYFKIDELKKKTLPAPKNSGGCYSIRKDDLDFKKEPEKFTEIRDRYIRNGANPLPPEKSRPRSLNIRPPSEPAPFFMKSEYSPAGDQPQAIKEITKAFKNGEQFQVLLGVTGSGKTFTMANVIKNLEKPAMILTHNKTLAAQLYQEFKTFFPENAVEYFVSYYDYYQPEAYVVSSDTFIDKDSSINDEIDKLRLRATKNLLTRRDTIIITSISCIYGLGSPAEYFELMVRINVGEERERDSILRDLVAIQYERNDYSLERGTFRVRGDRIDIYPSYDDIGFRVELFGDTVEKLSWFHLITGEKIKDANEIIIAPAKHFVTREESRLRITEQMQLELNERLIELQAQGKDLEAARLNSRTRYDMEMIREIGFCSGIENYSRIVERRGPGTRPYTLFDYFGDDWLLIIDESHASIPQARGMSEGDKARKNTLVEYGWRLPCAVDNRPMNFSEFEHEFPPNVLFVSATPADYEIKKTVGSIVEQINRPTGLLDPEIEVMPIEGQMNDLLARITKTISNGDRVLVTTLTKKMSQDLTDYLLEKKIKTRYLHSDVKTLDRHEIIRELRLGKFDVLVGINLLREGLDLPEVALVAILDADKEGFLRNHRSLIQTMGRASRNVRGHVVLYADKMTDSMKTAISETRRRREMQIEFNKKHNIEPKSVQRKLEETLEIEDPMMEVRGRGKNSKKTAKAEKVQTHLDDNRSIEELELAMKEAAAKLDFEEAAKIRDLIVSRSRICWK